jgi:hypothetical protein
LAGGAGVADPGEGGFEGCGEVGGVAFGLESEGDYFGFIAAEHGAEGDDIDAAGAEGVDNVVDFVVSEGELAYDAVLPAATSKEVEIGGDAGFGGDVAHVGLDPEVGAGEGDGEDAVGEGGLAAEGGSGLVEVVFEKFGVYGGRLGGGGIGRTCVCAEVAKYEKESHHHGECSAMFHFCIVTRGALLTSSENYTHLAIALPIISGIITPV